MIEKTKAIDGENLENEESASGKNFSCSGIVILIFGTLFLCVFCTLSVNFVRMWPNRLDAREQREVIAELEAMDHISFDSLRPSIKQQSPFGVVIQATVTNLSVARPGIIIVPQSAVGDLTESGKTTCLPTGQEGHSMHVTMLQNIRDQLCLFLLQVNFELFGSASWRET